MDKPKLRSEIEEANSQERNVIEIIGAIGYNKHGNIVIDTIG